MRFAQEWRSRHVTAGVPCSEVAKRIGSAWKGLPAAEQQRYNSLYENEKHQYAAAAAKYKGSTEQLEWKSKTGILAKEQKIAEKKAAEEAKKQKTKEKLRAAAAKKAAAKKAALRRTGATALLRKRRLADLKTRHTLKKKLNGQTEALKKKEAAAKKDLKEVARLQKAVEKQLQKAQKSASKAAFQAKLQ